MKRMFVPVSILLFFFTAGAAFADSLSATGSQGSLAYSALFENFGDGSLRITLSNTGLVAPGDETGVIGALFFSLEGDPTLTPSSMSLGGASVIVNGSGNPALNWEYQAGLSGPGGATQGLSASGYGVFGNRGNFCTGVNCGNLLQGIDWGLVDSLYLPGTGNSSIKNQPMIRDSAVFVLSGIPSDFDPSSGVTNISVQYTAELTGANISAGAGIAGSGLPSVPEPASYLLMSAGLIVIGAIGKSRRSRQSRT